MLNTFREPTLTVDLSRRWQIDAQLHDVILDAAGNSLLRSTIWDLRMRTERAFTYIADQRLEMFRQEHVVLIQTILNGDAVNAERLMREHLEHAKASLTDRRSL
jgi:DNA-binding FadR family transcriptional regulator